MEVIGNEVWHAGHKVAILAERAIPATVREEALWLLGGAAAEDLEGERDDLEDERDDLKGERDDLERERDDLREEVATLTGDIVELKRELAEAEAALKASINTETS